MQEIFLRAFLTITPDDRLKAYLGFGRPVEYHIFPATSYKDLPVLSQVGQTIFLWLPSRLFRGVYDCLPFFDKASAKKYFQLDIIIDLFFRK
jgi:hypothetical protein